MFSWNLGFAKFWILTFTWYFFRHYWNWRSYYCSCKKIRWAGAQWLEEQQTMLKNWKIIHFTESIPIENEDIENIRLNRTKTSCFLKRSIKRRNSILTKRRVEEEKTKLKYQKFGPWSRGRKKANRNILKNEETTTTTIKSSILHSKRWRECKIEIEYQELRL